MHTEIVTAFHISGVFIERFKRSRCLLKTPGKRRSKYRRHTVAAVVIRDGFVCFFRPVHKIMTVTAVYVYINKSRRQIIPAYVDHLVGIEITRRAAVGYLLAVNKHSLPIQYTVGGYDTRVYK